MKQQNNKEIVNEVLKEIMKQDNIKINLLKLRKSIEKALERKEKEMLDNEIKFLFNLGFEVNQNVKNIIQKEINKLKERLQKLREVLK